MLLYLDLNCLNRPFDDQSQDRVARETAAVFAVLERVISGVDRLAWSAVLAFENSQHPLPDHRREIARWAHYASVNVPFDERLEFRTRRLSEAGIGPLDAAHVAAAEAGGCERLLTCDDRLLRASRRSGLPIYVQNPLEYAEECRHV